MYLFSNFCSALHTGSSFSEGSSCLWSNTLSNFQIGYSLTYVFNVIILSCASLHLRSVSEKDLNKGLNEYTKTIRLKRFSFECRKVIGFTFATLHDWLKKFAPIFHPIRSKTKTNRDSLARIFPRFASATCNYFEF